MEVKLINYGIACRINDKIYVNKELTNYPELYKAILTHEKSHSSGFELKDVFLDLRTTHLIGLKSIYWRFVMKNPSSWVEFMPFLIYDGKISVNALILMFYGLILTIGGTILWIMN